MDIITTDMADLGPDIASLARAPYAGCLSIEVSGNVIVCAMPQVIELDEIAHPFCSPWVYQFTWPHTPDENEPFDFEPPQLLAAGRFTTVARRGTLPLPEWDQ